MRRSIVFILMVGHLGAGGAVRAQPTPDDTVAALLLKLTSRDEIVRQRASRDLGRLGLQVVFRLERDRRWSKPPR